MTEAKKHKTKLGCYYGTPEISSILAGFERTVVDLHIARGDYKPGSKAYKKHHDNARLEAATRIMQLGEQELKIARLKGIQWYAYELWRSYGNVPITDERLKKMLDKAEQELRELSRTKAGDAR
jgi:hypothetical protein